MPIRHNSESENNLVSQVFGEDMSLVRCKNVVAFVANLSCIFKPSLVIGNVLERDIRICPR